LLRDRCGSAAVACHSRESRSCKPLDLEDRSAGDALREAIKSRRYGKHELNFNCFDVVIDIDADTVEFVGAIDLDGLRAVLSADEVLDALRPPSDGRPS
jgi:hypothetical protein